MSNSPFEIFRRNLKPLMVLLTLLALFAFVVLPALDTYLRRGGGIGSDPVAASFDGIEVTGSRVTKITQTHAAVVRFLSDLAGETMRRGGMPQTPGFRYDEQSGQIQSLGIDARPGPENTVEMLKFSNEARKAGFELDDTAVANWLTRFSDGTLSDTEVTQILMRSTGNQLGVLTLYEHLRMHLLADLYQRAALVGLTSNNFPVVTPVGQWQNFLKLNQEATIDAYGVMVSSFLEKTDPNPSDSAIREVYEEGKERIAYPNDTSPEPKFKRPDSAKFEYLAADLNAFRQREIEKLSEEQLKAEYQRRLAGGDFQMPIESAQESPETDDAEEPQDSTESADAPEPTTEDPQPAEGSEPSTEKSSTEKSSTEEPSTEEPSTEEPSTEEPSTEEPSTEETSTEAPTAEEPSAEEATGEKPTEEKAPAADEQPEAGEEPAQPADKPTADGQETSEPSVQEAEPNDVDTEASVEQVEQDAEPATEDTSSQLTPSSVRLVAFQDESESGPSAPTGEDTAPDGSASDDEGPGSTQQDEPETTEEDRDKPASEATPNPETESGPEAPPSDSTEAPTDESADESEDDAAAAGQEDELALEEDPMRQQSFEEVRDEIAASLAEAPAKAALNRAVTEVNAIMRRYFSERSIHESNVSVGVAEEEDAPERPDLKALAEEYGLKAGKTDLVNRVSVQQTAPGGSFGLGQTANQRGFPFAAKMFGAQTRDGSVIPPQPMFAPIRTVDIENAVTYVTWKIEDVPSFVPALEEIRDEVILAVRTAQARQLAEAEAERIAGEVTDQPLSEVLPEEATEEVMTNLGPFSWLDQVGFMQTTVGNVEQLDNVGQAFMRAVFTTEVGSAAVGPNESRSVFYVIKPTKFQPDIKELQERFKQPQQRFIALLLGNQDVGELVRGFYESVNQRTNFEMSLPGEE